MEMERSMMLFWQEVLAPAYLVATLHQYQQSLITIVAGGACACVIAGRLAQADPTLSILIIEGGKNNLEDPMVRNPALYLTHLAPTSQSAIFYKAEPSKHLAGREAVIPCGGILGGGSSINFLMYTRAQGIDYDSWKTEGWDYKSVLPYLKKVRIHSVQFGLVCFETNTATE